MVCCFFIGDIVVLVSPFVFLVTAGVFVSSKVWVGLVTPLYRGDLVPPKVGTGLVTPLGFKPRTFRTGI